MSIIFERARLIGAVVICTGLFVWSTLAAGAWDVFPFDPTPAQQVADVRAGLAILEKAKAPMVDIQPCDAVKSFLPTKFSAADGALTMSMPSTRDVILCFKSDIDYGDALKAAQARKLFWQRGIGGDKFVVFAPNEARFLAVAKENGLTLGPDDLTETSVYMERLHPHARSQKEGVGWMIDPPAGAKDTEALFGPYVDLDPGAYDLRVGFEPVGGAPCAYFFRGLQIALAATANARVTVLAPKQPVALQLKGGRCRAEGHLSFTVPAGGSKGVEAPLWLVAPMRVKLVTYDLSRQF